MTINLIVGTISVLVVVSFGYISYRLQVLDFLGFMAATAIGCTVVFFGGIQWFILLTAFLIVASLTTKFRYDQKSKLHSAQENKGARGWRNVIANGGIAILSSLGFGFTNLMIFEMMFLGAVSTAAADTLATELGLLSTSEPRLITALSQRVRRGVSGGVTILGESATLLGSFSIAIVASIIGFSGLPPMQLWIISLISGFLGSIFDSLIGATLQSRYECSICSEETENRIHCNCPTRLKRGYAFIDNNLVNLSSTAVGALIAIGLLTLGIQ
jgi:uncharacterized protein (TIGR00297 family)